MNRAEMVAERGKRIAAAKTELAQVVVKMKNRMVGFGNEKSIGNFNFTIGQGQFRNTRNFYFEDGSYIMINDIGKKPVLSEKILYEIHEDNFFHFHRIRTYDDGIALDIRCNNKIELMAKIKLFALK